jgi:hypothetical protein
VVGTGRERERSLERGTQRRREMETERGKKGWGERGGVREV